MASLINTIRKPRNLVYTLGVSALIFDGYYLVMKKLPGVGDVPACTVAGALTIENLIFSGVISILMGVLFLGIVEMLRVKQLRARYLGPVGVGSAFAFFSVFCAVCTLPLISLFGLSLGFGFFTTYNLWFKLGSLVLLGLGLWNINKKLGDCGCG